MADLINDGQRVVEFLDNLFKQMDLEVSVSLDTSIDDKISINLESSKSSSLIGYRGEVLDSIQTLAGAVANKYNEEYIRVVVNCEDYREKREEVLVQLAKKLAVKAIKTGRKVNLEPMNAFERRIIHSALTDFANIKTESEGIEPNRHIVIIPENINGRDRGPKKSGYQSELIKTSKKTSGFGTYLGNSFKK